MIKGVDTMLGIATRLLIESSQASQVMQLGALLLRCGGRLSKLFSLVAGFLLV